MKKRGVGLRLLPTDYRIQLTQSAAILSQMLYFWRACHSIER